MHSFRASSSIGPGSLSSNAKKNKELYLGYLNPLQTEKAKNVDQDIVKTVHQIQYVYYYISQKCSLFSL